MAWTKATQITSWSFSRWDSYEGCPFKAKLKFIDKIQEPTDPNGPMARGDAIHKLADAYIKGELKRIPPEISKGQFGDFFRAMRDVFKKQRKMITIEETWALRKDWSVTKWNDWNGCWLRVKLDLCWIQGHTASVVDHKTGRYAPDYNLEKYLLQLDLYGTAALIIYAHLGPDLKVIPRLHFLDQDVIYPPEGEETKVYTPADLPRLKKEWEARTRPMLKDTRFAPKANWYCSSCFYRKDNKANGGGQCKF